MTARRQLGGGRVLGNGRELSPAAAIRPAQHQRNSSLLSPSESSVSLASQASNSNSPASTIDNENITSRISLDQNATTAAAAAREQLVCPICNDVMVTLLQLNRHIDDVHANLEEAEQDEVKGWFEKQMAKAKKFQPLAVINQRLKGLDVFESNSTPPPPAARPSSGTSTPEPPRIQDPDELVTRAHWQRPGYADACSDPACGRRLGGAAGNVNCRHCGKLFCEEHTMYQMKLSRSAHPEPVRGMWCRVCETCYKSRDGYNDTKGFERDHFSEFAEIRRQTVDKATLEVSRLEKRLTKLTQLLANPPPEHAAGGGSYLWPFADTKSQQRALEQSVITWEDDANILSCPFCQQEFSTYTFRRHHCRLCGRVVCGDPITLCSTEVPLNVAAEKRVGSIPLNVRMCKDCRHTLFSKSDYEHELAVKPPLQRAYDNLQQFERGIRLLLPRFQKLLSALQDPNKPPSAQQLQDASKVRKRLIDAFAQYDTAARRVRDLPTKSIAQQKLQANVYQQAMNFLSLHMLPLRSLPKILKHASPHANGRVASPGAASPHGRPQLNGTHSPRPSSSTLATLKAQDAAETSSTRSSASAELSAMEAEEKELRERLIVLEEQKFFVSEMLAEANKHRKFEEVKALAGNVEDLSKEIDHIQGQLGQLDFAGAYQNTRPG